MQVTANKNLKIRAAIVRYLHFLLLLVPACKLIVIEQEREQ
jgi:hypothetical protein